MIQQMFSAMNDKLNSIMEQYAEADEQQKCQLVKQLVQLKQLNDSFIDLWLDFEEKMADCSEQMIACLEQEADEKDEHHKASADIAPAIPQGKGSFPCSKDDIWMSEETELLVSRGQGYYKLFMFTHASDYFETAVLQSPACNIARLYLAMCYMHLQKWREAEKHFQLLISSTGFPKWLAMGYNALGCIEAIRMNIEGAIQLFKKAYAVYPGFIESLNNLKCCQETPKQLSLYFGSTELCCL